MVNRTRLAVRRWQRLAGEKVYLACSAWITWAGSTFWLVAKGGHVGFDGLTGDGIQAVPCLL